MTTKKPKPVDQFEALNKVPLNNSMRHVVTASFYDVVGEPLKRKQHIRDAEIAEKAFQQHIKQFPAAVRAEIKRLRTYVDPKSGVKYNSETYLSSSNHFTVNVHVDEKDRAKMGGRASFYISYYANNWWKSFYGTNAVTVRKDHPMYKELMDEYRERTAINEKFDKARNDINNALKKHRFVGKLLTEFPLLEQYLPMKEILADAPKQEVISAMTAGQLSTAIDFLRNAGKAAPKVQPKAKAKAAA